MKLIKDPESHIGELIISEAQKFKEECLKENMEGERLLDIFYVDGVKIDVKMYFEKSKL